MTRSLTLARFADEPSRNYPLYITTKEYTAERNLSPARLAVSRWVVVSPALRGLYIVRICSNYISYCPTGKCFRQRVSYLVHRRIHTNTQPYKCTACDKSFRYKVSQRTHKCPAQPPGTVIRQTGDLLQKLLQSSSILPTLNAGSPISIATPPPAPPPSIETPEQQLHQQQEHDDLQDIKSEDDINRTLDELLNESYDKMGIGEHQTSYQDDHQQLPNPYQHHNLHHSQQQQQQQQVELNGAGSAGETSMIVPRIESLCLLSPNPRDLMAFDGEAMEVIDSIKLDLLYN